MPSHRLAARRRATVATASAASVIVLGGLWFGSGDAAGGEAAAPPDPVIGTVECDALVDADAAVVAAVDDGLDAEALAELRAALAINLCDLDGATALDGTLAVDL